MPSSSFVVNSEFQPMSYQELLHPVITQTQYQRELDEKYTQLDLQADKLEQLANSAVDAESYEKYKSFANRLRDEASNLAKYGLRGRDSARFMDLFRSYGKEIQPLLDAQAKRERMIEQQRQLSLQDPTSLYDRSAGNISLQELMANPSAAPVRQSGELLYKQSAAMAQNLTREIQEATISKTNNPGYLAFKQKYGLSSKEIEAFVSDPSSPKANRVLKAIYDQVMTSSGVKENWEGDAYNKASQYVAMGLWSAIGPQQYQPIQDHWAMQQARFAHESAENAKNRAQQWAIHKDNQRFQTEMLAAQMGLTSTGDNNIIPVANLTPKEQQARLKEEEKWKQKGYISGNGNLTKKAAKYLFAFAASEGITNGNQRRKRINEAYAKATGRTGEVAFYDFGNDRSGDFYEFRQYIRKLGYDPKLMGEHVKFKKDGSSYVPYFDFIGTKEYGYTQRFKDSYNKRIDEIKNGYDFTRSMNFTIPTSESDGKSLISRAATGKNKVVLYDTEGKTKEVPSADLKDGSKIHSAGDITVNPANGEIYVDVSYNGIEYKLPIGKHTIGETRYNNIINYAKGLNLAGNSLNKQIKPNIKTDSNGKSYIEDLTNLSYNFDDPDDVGLYNSVFDYQKDAETNLTQNVVSILNQNKSEDSKISFINP